MIEGDELFNYMIHNFDNMFEGDSIIKHFDIKHGFYGYICDIDKIKEILYNDIQRELLIWIKKEYMKGTLINKENWKPFRDTECLSEMYFGYRKLFDYKDYYFQLIIENKLNNKQNIHFSLGLYAWKNINSNLFEPYSEITILPNNIIPDLEWNTQ